MLIWCKGGQKRLMNFKLSCVSTKNNSRSGNLIDFLFLSIAGMKLLEAMRAFQICC